MTSIAVLGAGAFGTALAISLARDGRDVSLWGRNIVDIAGMEANGTTGEKLPGLMLPPALKLEKDLGAITAKTLLIAVPMASLPEFTAQPAPPNARAVVACMKGIDPETGFTPTRILKNYASNTTTAVLTGPSFAIDIATGLPTALTLACVDESIGEDLQAQLSTSNLRLYRTTDVAGAELGGALKNVMAIAAGVAIGAGLGDSARAAIIARGMAEMTRIAVHFGADQATLSGLSGFGDLVLTATSEKSRNFRAGCAIGAGQELPQQTTEGLATAHAATRIAKENGIEAPIATTVSALIAGQTTPEDAITTLLSRPLKREY